MKKLLIATVLLTGMSLSARNIKVTIYNGSNRTIIVSTTAKQGRISKKKSEIFIVGQKELLTITGPYGRIKFKPSDYSGFIKNKALKIKFWYNKRTKTQGVEPQATYGINPPSFNIQNPPSPPVSRQPYINITKPGYGDDRPTTQQNPSEPLF